MTTAFFRTVILYFILMIGLRLMEKRQIGELEPSELVLTLIISDLAAVPMQDFGIPLVNGLFPIVTLLCLSMLISYFSLRSIRFAGWSAATRRSSSGTGKSCSRTWRATASPWTSCSSSCAVRATAISPP